MIKTVSWRRGFTLVEMLAVMFMLAVLGGIMAMLLKETMELERMQTEGFDKILQHNALADQFRADVGQAESAPVKWGDYQAGSRTLILQMPKGGHVVYFWKDDNLKRILGEDKKVTERLLPTGDSPVEFFANPKLIRMRLPSLRRGSPLPGQTLEFVAALGGDLR